MQRNYHNLERVLAYKKRNGLANEFFFFFSLTSQYMDELPCFYFLSLSNTIQSLSSLNYNL